MATPAQQFIECFHNLEGASIGVRRKNLFLQLRKFSSLAQPDLTELVDGLHPRHYQESIFRVEVLIHFRHFDGLIELLVSDNEILMGKIWRQGWFFAGLLGKVSARQLVEGMFPRMSYVVRMRVLRGLAKFCVDADKVDELFEVVLGAYGIGVASLLVTACSRIKFLASCREFELKLTFNQMILICHKSPSLLIEWVDSNKEKIDLFEDKHLRQIVSQDFDLFYNKFVKIWHKDIKLGKRLTRRLIRHDRNSVLADSEKFFKLIHLRTAYKELKGDYFKFLVVNLPKEAISISGYIDGISIVPKRDKYYVLEKVMRTRYKKSLVEAEEVINDWLLDVINDATLREKLVDAKLKKNPENYSLLKYLPVPRSVPLIKAKINVTNGVATRETLVEMLVDTCKINDDLGALLDVLDYFCKRHRNDDGSVKSSFLREILYCYDVTKFDQKYWDFIMEVVKIMEIKKEHTYALKNVYVKQMEYLFCKQQPVDHLILKYLKEYGSYRNMIDNYNDRYKNLDFNKYVIMKSLEYYDDIAKEKDDTFLIFDYYSAIQGWNSENKNNKISLLSCPTYLKSLRVKLAEMAREKVSANRVAELLQRLILHESIPRDLIPELKRVYWEIFEYLNGADFAIYMLKNEPTEIKNNLKKFCETSGCLTSVVWELVKRNSHIGLSQECIKYQIGHLNDREGRRQRYAALALAVLMDSDDFVSNVAQFIPTQERLSWKEEEDGELFNVQKDVAGAFKFTKSSRVLPTLVEFCKGDYLGPALESLYYLAYHSNEVALAESLKILAGRAVSVRKHSVKLSCAVGSLSATYDLLREFTQNEKNVSVIQHLFKATLAYFVKNKDERFWQLWLSQILKLDLNDDESYGLLERLPDLPTNYRVNYFSFMWDSLEKNKLKCSNSEKLRSSLIYVLTDQCYKHLPQAISSQIINKYFLNLDDWYIDSFVTKFLIYGPGGWNQTTLDRVFQIMQNYKNQESNDLRKIIQIKSKICSFLCTFYTPCRYDSMVDPNLIKAFTTSLYKVYQPVEIFHEYLAFNFLLFKKDVDKMDVLAPKVAEFLQDTLRRFECYVFDRFIEKFKEFIGEPTGGFNWLRFCRCLVANVECSTAICVLVLRLLPKSVPDDESDKSTFYEVLNKVKRDKSFAVQVEYNTFISALVIDED